MAPEQPTTIDLILLEQTLSNLQSFTKVPKSGTLSHYQLLLHPVSLPLRQKCAIKSWIEEAALTRFLFVNDSLCYKPRGFLRSPRHYCKFHHSFSFYFNKALGIKWPDEPIKALGVYYSYDPKLLHERNFIEKLDSIKKLMNIWSSRGLSIYGKVTVIKSLIIPRFVYIASLLPTPKDAIKELNQLCYLNFYGKVWIKQLACL